MEAAPGIAGGQGQINAVGKLSLLLKRKSVGVCILEGTELLSWYCGSKRTDSSWSFGTPELGAGSLDLHTPPNTFLGSSHAELSRHS